MSEPLVHFSFILDSFATKQFFDRMITEKQNLVYCHTDKNKITNVVLPDQKVFDGLIYPIAFCKEEKGVVKFYNTDDMIEPVYIFQSWKRIVEFKYVDGVLEAEEVMKDDCDKRYGGYND